MADPGFPRGGADLLFGIIFTKNCMKIKQIGLKRAASLRPPRSATGLIRVTKQEKYGLSYTYCMYSMCAHSGALKRFSGISAERTIWILIIVYVITFLINLLYF